MLRIAAILPGLGRVQRGAETAFLEISRALARLPDIAIDVFGSGSAIPEELNSIIVPCQSRERFERWPKLPALRSENHYEELSFVWNQLRSRRFRPGDYDATLSCTYPYVNWLLQSQRKRGRPKLIFITQNGDWMCRRSNAEYRFFHCDGLVCINPEHYERHRGRYASALIPNGVDPSIYRPGDGKSSTPVWSDPRVPGRASVVLMASALISSKQVGLGIEAASKIPEAFLIVAGDGPEREKVTVAAKALMPGRHLLLGAVDRSLMPSLYRRASAFLHMSQDEPFGIVYLEAAASGLPIVAPDYSVTRWILGDSAVWMHPDRRGTVVSALRLALDPARKAKIGSQARARVLDGWTWDAQARKYRDFIEETVGRSDRSKPHA